eukprot:TRINITY_DN6107_c0_g1_i1.p1 TRINITY_DN6107_c0_g1~~TRINITY_DN6107_c0_g1_i1.p1  ORF type:complete len:772 (+),score=182.93 TRINITY_DN6107_c0_g1_i1:890-3205(+)
MAHHTGTVETLCEALSVNPATGLTEAEAAKRLEQSGKNSYTRDFKALPFWRYALHEIQEEPLLQMLLVVGVIYSALGAPEDAVTIFVIIFITIYLEVSTELRAKNAMRALEQSTPQTCAVRRGGVQVVVPAENVVAGDIVILSPGNAVCCDMRVLKSFGLLIDESSLTGESVRVLKQETEGLADDIVLAERVNMVFSGTVVAAGHGVGVVVAIGLQTERGKLHGLLKAAKQPKSQLQLLMKKLAKTLTICALSVSILIPLLALLVDYASDGSIETSWKEYLLTGLSLAFATIPEELPMVIAAVLSLGSLRMSNHGLLVKRIHVTESLGRTTYILSDKTGTLTQNKLSLHTVCLVNSSGMPESIGVANLSSSQAGVMSAAWWMSSAHQTDLAISDPFDFGFRAAIDKMPIASALKSDKLVEACPSVFQIPFSSQLKRSTQVRRVPYEIAERSLLLGYSAHPDAPYGFYSRGAPEKLLDDCQNMCCGADLGSVALTDSIRATLHQNLSDLTARGLRVIAVARHPLSVTASPTQPRAAGTADGSPTTEIPAEFQPPAETSLIGLFAFEDPLRPSAQSAVQNLLDAGVRVVIVTGDHKNTALAVAQSVGLIKDAEKSTNTLNGAEIDRLSDSEILERIKGGVCVVMRATPTHKHRLVTILQKAGEVVAVTGDGMNDSAAVKSADVGIAMGENVSAQVVTDVAGLVLVTNDFVALEYGIQEGRRLYDNTQKAIGFYLTCKFGLVLSDLQVWARSIFCHSYSLQHAVSVLSDSNYPS